MGIHDLPRAEPPVLPLTAATDDPHGSVTAWLDALRAGDADATRRLWDRYFRQMVRYSHTRLWGADRRAADEEDVALSAFASFCRGAQAGRFQPTLDRNRLWPLLARIVSQKAADRVSHDRCVKRGGRVARDDRQPLDALAADDPPPDVLAELSEAFHALLVRLPDLSLRAVAVLRFEGHSADDIARRLGCGVRTVERKLLLIRRLWAEASP